MNCPTCGKSKWDTVVTTNKAAHEQNVITRERCCHSCGEAVRTTEAIGTPTSKQLRVRIATRLVELDMPTNEVARVAEVSVRTVYRIQERQRDAAK